MYSFTRHLSRNDKTANNLEQGEWCPTGVGKEYNYHSFFENKIEKTKQIGDGLGCGIGKKWK